MRTRAIGRSIASMLRLTEIAHGSDEYGRTVALRDAVLRRPLGLAFTPEELAKEGDSLHLAAFEGREVVGCLVLRPIDADRVQMRQVAVAEARQRRGVGRKLAEFAERRAVALGFREMVVHARESAAEFYTRLGYVPSGAPFREVGLVHYHMHKALSASPS